MKENDTTTGWKTDIVNWPKLTVESAKLYITQAENRLTGTVETSKIITAKTELLSAISITIISASIYYFFNGNIPFVKAISFFAFILMLPICFFLIKNWKKYEVATVGEEPQKIFTSKFIDTEFSENEQYINLVFQVMETLQFKIDLNHQTNTVRQRNLTIAKRCFLALPLVFILATFYQYYCGYYLLWSLSPS
jgi:hypothetical protein